MAKDACDTYEHWRQRWLSGGGNHGITALQFHGMREALLLTVLPGADLRPPPGRPMETDRVLADAVLAEAASQVRHLLRTSPAGGTGGGRHA
ncbi:MAG: hypothetical protein OXF74_08760 [Rhodobacteraceae bacterium]|nr:hypothetical protein [Paracoccaceae bacterium]